MKVLLSVPKRLVILLLCATLLLGASGCYTLTHTVGNGMQTGVEQSERQWYALFGLVPLGKIDGGRMAGGATDYQIETEWTFVDILLNLITGYLTIHSRTVTVTK